MTAASFVGPRQCATGRRLAGTYRPLGPRSFVPPLQVDEHVLDRFLPELARDLVLRPDRDEMTARQERETRAARRLVHVVRGDEDRRPAARERVDPVPEQPPRGRIDA